MAGDNGAQCSGKDSNSRHEVGLRVMVQAAPLPGTVPYLWHLACSESSQTELAYFRGPDPHSLAQDNCSQLWELGPEPVPVSGRFSLLSALHY